MEKQDIETLRATLLACSDAIDTGDCDEDEDGEPHECRKTRAIALLSDSMAILERAS